jgi:hypothetical protein
MEIFLFLTERGVSRDPDSYIYTINQWSIIYIQELENEKK